MARLAFGMGRGGGGWVGWRERKEREREREKDGMVVEAGKWRERVGVGWLVFCRDSTLAGDLFLGSSSVYRFVMLRSFLISFRIVEKL